MKHLTSLLVCLLFTVGAPYVHAEQKWGVLRTAVENTDFAIDKLLHQQPVIYDVSAEVSPQEENVFVHSLKQWPKQVLKVIEASGRADEFQDIVRLLRERTLTVSKRKQGDSQSPDIIFSTGVVSACPEGQLGCFKAVYPRTLFVQKQPPEKFAGVTLHEVGHYFGLADTYDEKRSNADLTYSSDPSDFALMKSNSDDIRFDDVDGFINLIDLRLFQQNGSFPPRASKGWNSLDPDSSNRYWQAMTLNRRAFDYWVDPGNASYIYHENVYREGRFRAHRSAVLGTEPFELMRITQEDQVITDPVTRRVWQIISPVRINSVWYEGKEEERHEQGMLKRVFTYAGPYGQGAERFIKVYVNLSLTLPGEEERKFGQPVLYFIGEDGSVRYDKDSAYTLTAEHYAVSGVTEQVTAKLQQEQVLEMTVTSSQGSLTGYPQTGELAGFVTDSNGKPIHFSRQDVADLSRTHTDISLLVTTYYEQLALLTHFYNDFYQPLFFGPPPKTTPEPSAQF